MSGVKIQLSLKERELVQDPGIILTKNSTLAAIMEMLGDLSRQEQQYVEEHLVRLPPDVNRHFPKISRGEQYRGLPWQVLDYPRVFTPGATLAIRQFFWWGNFFSSTLQVAGVFKDKVVNNLESIPAATNICVHPSPWEHHFGPDNYRLVTELDAAQLQELLHKKEFLKLAMVLPIQSWETAPGFLMDAFRNWMDLLTD